SLAFQERNVIDPQIVAREQKEVRKRGLVLEDGWFKRRTRKTPNYALWGFAEPIGTGRGRIGKQSICGVRGAKPVTQQLRRGLLDVEEILPFQRLPDRTRKIFSNCHAVANIGL